jgi:glycosyltransferase involved in cell wall biosynthesis
MIPSRTLIIAETLPYPTYKGGDLRNWQNVNELARLGEVGIFGLCSNDQRTARMPQGVALWRSSTDPMLAYPPPTDRKLASRGWALEPMGHPSDLSYSETAAAEIETVMAEFRPDVLVIEGLWLHRYIAHAKRRPCHVILDCHNVETALYRQRAAAARGSDLRTRLIRDILPGRTATIERHATRTVDQIWVCSDADALAISELHRPAAPVWVVPNGVDPAAYRRLDGSGVAGAIDQSRPALIFPGSFAYWPNAAAASFLTEEFFPLLAAAHPEYQLLLVGSQPTQTMLQAAKRDARIIVTGAVADVRPYLAAASALLVPLFEGGGTRFKILEAFAAGVPVVSTAKGAEGLNVRNETHLLIAETADQMLAAVQRVLSDNCLRQRLTGSASELMNRYYSWDVVGRQIRAALSNLKSGISCNEEGKPSL